MLKIPFFSHRKKMDKKAKKKEDRAIKAADNLLLKLEELEKILIVVRGTRHV